MNMNFVLSAPGADVIEVEGEFRAPVDRVWRAWTEPEQLRKWFGAKGGEFSSMEVDVRVGGRWRFEIADDGDGGGALEGTYLSVVPGELLEFSWSHVSRTPSGALEATPTSKVSVAFREEGALTRLTLRHEGIQTNSARRNVGGGWEASFARLAAHTTEAG